MFFKKQKEEKVVEPERSADKGGFKALLAAYTPGAPKEIFERRKKIDRETQAFLDKHYFSPDYHHWLGMAYWEAKEVLCLFAGFIPRLLDDEKKPHISDFPDNIQLGMELKAQRIVELLTRALEVDDLGYKERPATFIQWAQRRNIELPRALADIVNGTEEKSKKPTKEKALGTRERETLLKLIIGMAVAGYRYDPKAAKNAAITDIANDLDSLGISVSDDTIRSKLNEAAELLPQEVEEV